MCCSVTKLVQNTKILYQWTWRITKVRALSMNAVSEQESGENVKPFSEIPGPKGLPIVGTLFETVKMMNRTYVKISEGHKKYGPIYKEKFGNWEQVFLTDVEAIEQLLRQDGPVPERVQIPLWLENRKRTGEELGLVTSSGEQWRRMRIVVNKPMLKIKTVNSFTKDFNDVVTEFLSRLSRIRTKDNAVPKLDEELFNWSLESVSRILYEKRFGSLSDKRDPQIDQFIESVHTVLEMTRKLIVFPPSFARVFLRKWWKKHEDAWETTFRIARISIDEKIESLKQKEQNEDEIGLMAYLLSQHSISLKEVYANVSELMGGAVDTTSNTMQFMLSELSRNPECQKAVYDEVMRLVPPGEIPDAKHLKEMHYLKAVIKETLRLYPVGSLILRVLQHDATLLGYHIPAGTLIFVSLYVLGRLPNLYTDPDHFRPERWLRDGNKERPHAFAWLPFGFGPRMCVGRRVAELEMQLLVSRLVRQFRIDPVSMDLPEIRTDLLLRPSKPVEIKLVDRK